MPRLKSPLLYVYAIMPCEKNIMDMDSGNHHIYFQYQKSTGEFNILRADNNKEIGSFPAESWWKELEGDGSEMKLKNYYSNTKSKLCNLTIQPCNKEIYKSSCPQKDKDYSDKWSDFIKAWFSGKSGIQSTGIPALPLPPGADIEDRIRLELAIADQNYKPPPVVVAAEKTVTAAEQKYGTGSDVDPAEVTTLLAKYLPEVPSNDPSNVRKGGKRKTKKSKKSRRKTKKSRRKTKKAKRKLKRSKRKH